MAVCQEFDMETDSDVIPSIASGFAGGIGNTGSVCGSVIGAVMAIGLKQGRARTIEDMLVNLKVVEEFRRRFEAEHESINCRDLTGMDLSTAEGIKQFMSSDKPRTVCYPAVTSAYRIVTNLLKET